MKEEANWKCEVCNFDKRREDSSCILEIDHIDGDTLNYSRENLVALCPNCHALTSTFLNRRGKGKGNKRYSTKWKKVLEKDKKFVEQIKDAYENKSIDFSEKSWPSQVVKKFRRARGKEELVVLKIRKLLPRFYVEKCFNVFNENELFDSKIEISEYAFF